MDEGAGANEGAPDIKVKIPGIPILPRISVVSDENGISNMLLDEDSNLLGDGFSWRLEGYKEPEVKIFFNGFFDVGFPAVGSPPIRFPPGWYEMSEEEQRNSNTLFFNKNSLLNPVTTEDFMFKGIGDSKFFTMPEEKWVEIYSVDHGYFHPCDPRFQNHCDYAMTATCVLLFDKITDLDVAIELLNKECNRNLIDFDLSETLDLSKIIVCPDNGWRDNNDSGSNLEFRYSMNVDIVTEFTKSFDVTDWRTVSDDEKLEILRAHIEKRGGRIDLSYIHDAKNLIELEFYSVVAKPSGTTIAVKLLPLPMFVGIHVLKKHRYVPLETIMWESGEDGLPIVGSASHKIPDGLHHGPQDPEQGYECNPIWNLRYQMLYEAASNAK